MSKVTRVGNHTRDGHIQTSQSGSAYPEHPSERSSRLRIEEANARLQRWKEGILFGAIVCVTVGACAVWVITLISGQFSPDEKNQVTELLRQLLMGLLGVLAGRNLKKN